MNKLYIALATLAVIAGVFMAGDRHGKLSLTHDLDQLEIKRQKQVTALTLEVTGKQKEISAIKRKNLETIRNAKVDSCADEPLPDVFVGILRERKSP